MAAVTHLRSRHAALMHVVADDVGERLTALAAELFSADAATRAIEQAFLGRLVRILTLAPHEIHDLAVSGRLGGLLPPDAPEVPAAPVRFTDIAPWREPK